MRIRWTTAAGFAVVALVSGAIALNGIGCGDDDEVDGGAGGPEPVTVTGNVDQVFNEGNTTTAATAGDRWLAWIGPGEAIAQEECSVDSILACVRTNLAEGETPVESCSQVSPTTCLFEVEIELVDDIEIFFVDDRGDGSPDDPEDEPQSTLQNGPGEVCAGQTITLTDVEINFAPTESSLALEVESDPPCPTPTPTPEPTATPTETPTP